MRADTRGRFGSASSCGRNLELEDQRRKIPEWKCDEGGSSGTDVIYIKGTQTYEGPCRP